MVLVERGATRLATEPAVTPLVAGMVTTVEQTILDFADRPNLRRLAPREVGEVVRPLAVRADWDAVLDWPGPSGSTAPARYMICYMNGARNPPELGGSQLGTTR